MNMPTNYFLKYKKQDTGLGKTNECMIMKYWYIPYTTMKNNVILQKSYKLNSTTKHTSMHI